MATFGAAIIQKRYADESVPVLATLSTIVANAYPVAASPSITLYTFYTSM